MESSIWFILAGFYIPLHFAGPLLLVFFTVEETARKGILRLVVIEGLLVMVLAFGLAIYLAGHSISQAVTVLFLSTLLPYVFFCLHRHLKR